MYVASHSPTGKRRGASNLKAQTRQLKVSRDYKHQQYMKEELAHLTMKRLYFMSTPDVVDAPVRVRPPSPVCTPDEMSKAIDTFVQHNPAHHITQILHRLGLTKAGARASNEVRKEKLRTGAKTLMRYILREYNEIDQADSI